MKIIFALPCIFYCSMLFSQNVGIGTATPTHPLTVMAQGMGVSQQGGNNRPVAIGFYTDSTNGGAYVQTHTRHNLQFATANGIGQMVLDTLGNVGVGVDPPSQKLDVGGAVRIAGTNVAGKGTIRYTQADSSFQGYDNSRWKSLINNVDVVGEYTSGNAPQFQSVLRNQYVNIPSLTYTIKKNGVYLVILGATGSGTQEKNDIFNLNDNREDFQGEIRLSTGNDPVISYLKKIFFYTYTDAGVASQDPPRRFHSDDGEKTVVRYFNAGDIIKVNVYIEQSVGAQAPAQATNWYVNAQVKYILLN